MKEIHGQVLFPPEAEAQDIHMSMSTHIHTHFVNHPELPMYELGSYVNLLYKQANDETNTCTHRTS